MALRTIGVRLRFPVILAVAFLVVGRWDVLRTYWGAITRPALGARAPGPISADTEYFCPMDPGVVADWPAKCSICNMALVRRKKGEAVPLPDGVVARMQISPYRVQLAGIRTATVGYEPLEGEVETASGAARVAIAATEPFRSMPADPPPRRKGEPKAVYTCPEHAEIVREKPGRCPIDEGMLDRRPLLDTQRVGWWCPMHPEITADRPGARCEPCGGMALVPRVVNYNPKGRVLAVPESAVVDTGRRKVVFVERMPGMFDGVEVTLGPRCGAFYPVVRGLEPGQAVATSGAFLLDAETRLNPALASAYFGAAKGAAEGKQATPAANVATCPVTGKPLGSMGPPVTVRVEGRDVLLCCEGCEAKLRANPGRYLSRAPGRRP